MSIKRGTQVGRAPARRVDDRSPWQDPKPVERRKWVWASDVAGQPDESFVAYTMTMSVAPGTLLLHPKFGKGVVTSIDGPNAEVLFEEGTKRLRCAPPAPAAP